MDEKRNRRRMYISDNTKKKWKFKNKQTETNKIYSSVALFKTNTFYVCALIEIKSKLNNKVFEKNQQKNDKL